MKLKFIFPLLLVFMVATSCTKEDNKVDVPEDLKVEMTNISITESEVKEIRITSGSGNYQLFNSDESIIKASLTGNIISVEGLKKGQAILTVTDLESKQTALIQTLVEIKTRSMEYISGQVIEFNQNGVPQDIPTDKLGQYWGKRIQDNTPSAIKFYDTDSLLIIKPFGLEERHKIRWIQENLYIYNDYTQEWELCGKEEHDHTIVLNTCFYHINSMNDARNLNIIGQTYNIKGYQKLSNFSEGIILWTKMAFVFKDNQH